ncbi:MAG: hypothetical protein H6500_03465 [Candidatus Woesearchaeota archaeon]|nr:hypothetical protein [Nanoarchaeota archaeon]USN44874.1 MAG: hypothetical protein H6500_03465 [Candidatus Woesearchaeota archaeon]
MPVKCRDCEKEITSQKNINILAFLGFSLHVLCNNCYCERVRSFMGLHYYVKTPLNSARFMVLPIVLTSFIFIYIGLLLFFYLGVKPAYDLMLANSSDLESTFVFTLPFFSQGDIVLLSLLPILVLLLVIGFLIVLKVKSNAILSTLPEK